MAALAYLVPPFSGLFAYLKGRSARMRAHGLQAVLLGVFWPASLFVGAWISPGTTQAVFVVDALLWLGVMVATAAGRDLLIPGLAGTVRGAAGSSLYERDEFRDEA